MRIVAVAGKMRAGKDTFGEVFLEHHPEFIRVAFADPLKEEYAATQNISVEEVNLNKDFHRQNLIDYGQFRRDQEPLYWVNKAVNTPGDKIITDVRFLNEFEALKALGAVMVRVESDLGQRSKRGLIISDSTSETALDNRTDWDFVLYNNLDLESFKQECHNVQRRIY